MKCIFFLLTLLLFCSCIRPNVDPHEFEPKFVVEALIETEDYPVVKITHNIPSKYIIDTAQLEELIIRWATVKISTDDNEEVLTLIRDDDTFPFYYYVGKRLKGVAGKQYQLHIQYSGINLYSTTKIPLYPPKIDSAWFRKVNEEEYQPYLRIDNSTFYTGANYRFYTKPSDKKEYFSTSPRGVQGRNLHEPYPVFALLRNKSIFMTDTLNSNYYHKGETVDIKIANISAESYDLWAEMVQQSVQYSFLAYTTNFTGNITGPAIGIWHGANTKVVRLKID